MKQLKNKKLKTLLGLLFACSASSAWAVDSARVVLSVGDTDLGLGVHSPDMKVDGDGRIHVVWMQETQFTDSVPTTYTNFNVMYKLLDYQANVLMDTTQISDSVADGNNHQGHPSIAVDANNNAYVSWFSSDTEDGFLVGVDPSKAPLDGTASTLATIQKFAPVGVADCKRSDLAIGSNGNVHMACSTGSSEVQMAVYGPDGSEVTAPYVVSNSTIYDSYGISRVHLALDSNNRGTIVYMQDYDDSIAYSLVDGVAGTTLTAHTVLTATNGYHPSVSMSGDMVYFTYMNADYDEVAGPELIVGSFTPSNDDMSGDAASLATIGYSDSAAVSGIAPLGWYMSSQLGADDEFMVTYNTGGGNGIAPRFFAKIDKTGVITTAETALDTDVDNSGYETYANYVAIAQQDTNLLAYTTDEDPASVILARADGTSFITAVDPNPPAPPAPEPEPEAPASSDDNGIFGLSLWALLGVTGLVGLLRARRRK